MSIMKQTKIFLSAVAAASLLAAGVYAQDAAASSSDDFGSDFASDTASGAASPSSSAVTVGGEAELDGRVYVDEDNDSGDKKAFENWDAQALPKGKLDIKYEGSKSDIELKLAFSKDVIETYHTDIIDELTMRAYLGNFVLEGGKMKLVWGKGDKLHVVDNFNANDYTDFLIPDYIDRRLAEPMVHIVFNAPKNIGNLSSVRLEGVYTPFMTADRFATSGRWTPASYTALASKVEGVEKATLAKSFTAYTTATATAGGAGAALQVAKSGYDSATAAVAQAQTAAATALANYTAAKTAYETSQTPGTTEALMGATSALATAQGALATAQTTQTAYQTSLATAQTAYAAAETELTSAATDYAQTLSAVSSFSASSLYPDMYQLKYGQAGARITATSGIFDWGLSYYYGHNKQPSADWNGYIASAAANKGTSYVNPSLDYDRLQVFGAEGAVTLGGFNFRGEFAYNLTDDTAGDDPWTHNNSIAWVAGFDKDLPISSMNINVQTTGRYTLNNDKIEDGAYKTSDVDYDSCGYSDDKIVVNISDSFDHEKIKPEVTAIYGFEHYDFMVMPKVTINIADGLAVSGSGLYIANFKDDSKSEFSSFLNNSFFQLGMKYTF